MLRHGGSFVVGYPVRTTRTVKEPPLSIPHFNSFWDIPLLYDVLGNILRISVNLITRSGG